MGTSNKLGRRSFGALNALISDRRFEVVFVAVFSVLISAIFYVLISMNGVVLGNDPAVHLEKAQIFLNTGQISLANIGWTPPLYQIVLAMFISLSGAADMGQMIFLVKVVAVICDWLFVFSAYLIASKFFDKRVGLAAVVLLLMCFPVFEANQFGGYTTVLALAFMLLVFLYTPLAVERLGYLTVAFFVAFGVVLSHQLAMFLAVFIMPPILLYMLIKSRGKHFKVVLALLLGGGVAFFLYYFTAMIGYLDEVIKYVFFAIKAYAYQIPATNFDAFLTNFGFVLFLAIAGVAVASYQLWKQKKPLIMIILMLSLLVPLFFAQSHFFGLYMPFGWFIYYLTPAIAILAAVSAVFLADRAAVYYAKHRQVFKKNWVRVAAILLVVLVVAMVIYRADVVYGKIMEASVYYSTTDAKAFDAGVWLKANYPPSTVITTYVPGFWFQEFSGMFVIAQTDPTVQRNEIAESVLSLSYEFDNIEYTMVRGYEAKGDILDETYVTIDQVWDRVSFSSGSGDFLYYTINGVSHKASLSSLNRQVVFEDQDMPKKIIFSFFNDDFLITKTLALDDRSYAIKYEWAVTPLKSQMQNASLYLTTLFDLKYRFEKAQIPGHFDWVNPWDAPAEFRDTYNTTDVSKDWATVNFTASNLQQGYIGLYDEKNNAGFALRFADLPNWGNIGALGNGQIDAVRVRYDFGDIGVNEAAMCSYQALTLSKNSYSTLEPNSLLSVFDFQPFEVTVNARDFTDDIRKYNVDFVVYDKNVLDTQMIHSKLLQLIYSNDRYVIFKIIK
jgi:hypothetical protein